MRFHTRHPLFVALAAVLMAKFAVGAEENRFVLVRDGKPACSIVLSDHPTPSARFAALELQFHLFESTGALAPIRSEAEAGEGPSVYIGDSGPVGRLGFEGSKMPAQEYLEAVRPNALVLLGRDWEDTPANRAVDGRPMTGETLQGCRHKIDYWKAVGRPEKSVGEMELPGLYDDQGSLLAVYDFLERAVGVRWYGPAPLHVIIPRTTEVAVSGPDLRRSPALKHRDALPGGNWPFLHGQWGEFSTDQVRLYWRRIRQGGERWSGNHTFYPATIKAAFQDPEYQSKNPKTKGSQLCYSNPALVGKVAQMARDYFDGKGGLPEGWRADGDYFAIVPDDNMNLCTCPACAELVKRGEGLKSPFFSNGEISDYWFSFVNAVAREVRKTHPEKYVATLAYWAYAKPPSFDLEPNVSVAPCLHTCYYPSHPEMRENDMALYEGWRVKSHAPMFLWTYYHHPMEAGLVNGYKCFPNMMPHATAAAMAKFIRDGVRGVYECGEQDQLEQYVITRVWDNPLVDVDAVMGEFFRLYFGAAAAPMKEFYQGLESAACDPVNYAGVVTKPGGIDWKKAAWERLGTAERLETFRSLLERAAAAGSNDAERRRVALWKSALYDWMVEGRKAYFTARTN
jgi:Domain of unknown function (DUF4838)